MNTKTITYRDSKNIQHDIDLKAIVEGTATEDTLRDLVNAVQQLSLKETQVVFNIPSSFPSEETLLQVLSQLKQINTKTVRDSGVGSFQKVPPGSAVGTPLPNMPQDCLGVEFYLRPGEKVVYTLAKDQPIQKPSVRPATAENPAMNDIEMPWPVSLADGMRIYIISKTSSGTALGELDGPTFRVM